MDSPSQVLPDPSFPDVAQHIPYAAEPQATPPYFTYHSRQCMDSFLNIDQNPFSSLLYTPLNLAPQSNIRTQQQLREPSNQTLQGPIKRRKVNHNDGSMLLADQVESYTASQLPLSAFESAIPRVESEPTFSQCCSSCSDGPPCDEPDCEDQREKVVPCMETDCEAPVCTDKCIYPSGLAPNFTSAQQDLNSVTSVLTLQESLWNEHPSKIELHARSNANVQMGRCGTQHYQDVNKVSSSADYGGARPYFNPLTTSRDASGIGYDYMSADGVLTGTGDLFSGAHPNQFPRECEWSSCGQVMQTSEQCLQHLHEMHFDPQMIFSCPTELPTCQDSIIDPMDHLTNKHGWTVPTYDEKDFRRCPAPSCQEDGIYMDPQQLHHHFDEVHSTPVEGGLQCRWSACSTVVPDPHSLFTHLNEEHQLPIPVKGVEDIDLTPDTSSSLQTSENHLSCKWITKSGQLCGAVCINETELHEHVKRAHLQPLKKSNGYLCHWEDCRRNLKLGESRGFSQKGKLERHMASHTGYKCCKCDWVNPDGTICNATFSAPQAYNQHRLLHTGERPWPCKYCGKTFPQQSAKTIHERTHTKEKPLKCEFCDMRFSESSNLAKHRKTHGEKGKYACAEPGCSKSYHRLDQLKHHASSHRQGMKDSPQVSTSDSTSPDLA